MSARRQKENQCKLPLSAGPRGEAPKTPMEGTGALVATGGDESPGGTERLMEEVCEREKLLPLTRNPFSGRNPVMHEPTEPPCADPHARWCGRGRPRGPSLSRSKRSGKGITRPKWALALAGRASFFRSPRKRPGQSEKRSAASRLSVPTEAEALLEKGDRDGADRRSLQPGGPPGRAGMVIDGRFRTTRVVR